MPSSRRAVIAATCAALAVASAACGGDDATGDADAAPAVTTTDPPSTTAPPQSDRPESPPTTIDDAPSGPSDDVVARRIETVLAKAMKPGSIQWKAFGVDAPPTAVVAAVRIPGRDDVLVAVGENVDGSPADADAPFSVSALTESLVRSVAFQLVDEGVLDPTLTVDRWVPTLPNADRVTVQMVIDNETGWSEYGPLVPDPVVTDLERRWTLREVVELEATTMTALAEPGTRTDDRLTGEDVLGLIVQEVGGRPLSELVRRRVTEPTGLDDTLLLDGRTFPDGFRHGRASVGDVVVDTSMFPPASFFTFHQATYSMASTPTDLLDLLDVWTTGELFTTDRTPAPDRYAPDPAGNPDVHIGLGVPFNAYCPCTEVEGGIEPDSIGRSPTSSYTRAMIHRYADGTSVVVHFNADEVTDPADLVAVESAVHDIAAAAR